MPHQETPEFLGGAANEHGFSLQIALGNKTLVFHISPKGLRVETLPRLPHTWWGEVIRIFSGPLGLLIPHPTGKALAALFNIALSLFFFQDKPMPFHKTILAFGISYALAVLFLRITGVVRWHALEHKSAHVLEDIWRGRLALSDLSEDNLVQALKKASPLHPWCGSLYMIIFIFAASVLFSLLPSGPAFLGSLVAIYFLWGIEPLNRLLLPAQIPFVAEPREEQYRVGARGVLGILEELQKQRALEAD